MEFKINKQFIQFYDRFDIFIGKFDIFKHNCTQNVLTYDHHLCVSSNQASFVDFNRFVRPSSIFWSARKLQFPIAKFQRLLFISKGNFLRPESEAIKKFCQNGQSNAHSGITSF